VSQAQGRVPSLKTRVLRHVMLPLALTWGVGTVVALIVATYFTQQAFDRALADDAYSLAANVHISDGRPELLLSPREMGAVLFDQAENVYFALLNEDGSLIAGQADLHAPSPEPGHESLFSDIDFHGQPLRAVRLHDRRHALPFDVVMAQTTHARAALLNRLLVFAVVPQVLLLALLALWLWRDVGRDLAPLGALQRTLDQRDASDLSPVAVAGTTRELERLGNAVNSLFKRLEHSVRAQREFAGNVAHELRTPLAGIRALADYGLAQKTPTVWREQLERIAASQSRASHLVDQLLGLALADEAHAALQREPVRLDQLAGQAVLRHLARADAQGVDLGARGLDDACTVQGNPALVEGILDNLIDNALRYGGRTITIELAPGAAAQGPVLSVVDDGPGIAAEAQRRLMQRWEQGAAGHMLGQGAGLGLAIVARYAQLLGAQLGLANVPDGGGLRVSVAFGPQPSALR
jgi:two-component system sensor histidine kinase TctE